jgi:hypothetical protein
MKTLKELRELMNTGSAEEKLAASMELNNYLLTYNEEYNALLDLEASVTVALYEVTHNPHGINHAYRLDLETLQTKITARKAFLDMKLRAFHHSEIGINAPDQATIDKVKELADKVAKKVLKEKAIDAVIAALTDIANIVNGTMAPA